MKTKKTGVLVIVQARMGSSRLLGKILIKLDGKPLIQHTIERAKKADNVDKVIIATSVNKENDVLEDLCKKLKIPCYRGSEDDVLDRFVNAAETFNPKLIVRICGDEPLLDTALLEKSIEMHINSGAEYSTTVGAVPKGLDVEIINYIILKEIAKISKKELHREHVTKYILDNPKKFKINRLDFGNSLRRPDIVLTVDTKDDLEFVKEIYLELKKRKRLTKDSSKDIIELVDKEIVKRKPTLLMRADGSKDKGIGDLVSLVNIAKKLEKDYKIIFASKDYHEGTSFLKKNGYETLILPLDISEEDEIDLIKKYCKTYNIKYLLIELVPNNSSYARKMSQFMKTMVIDFEGGIDVYSDILLCWDIDAKNKKYNLINKDTMQLLGSRFVPLNDEILKYKKKNQRKDIKNIVVTFGGADPHNITFEVYNILKNYTKKYDITFILGPAFKFNDQFEKISKKDKISIIKSPKDIHKILSDSDLVISNGGLTAFELCALNIPFIGISRISWEINRLRKMSKIGACKYIEYDNMKKNLVKTIEVLNDYKKRQDLIKNASNIVDGKGSKRISDMIKRWAD